MVKAGLFKKKCNVKARVETNQEIDSIHKVAEHGNDGVAERRVLSDLSHLLGLEKRHQSCQTLHLHPGDHGKS